MYYFVSSGNPMDLKREIGLTSHYHSYCQSGLKQRYPLVQITPLLAKKKRKMPKLSASKRPFAVEIALLEVCF